MGSPVPAGKDPADFACGTVGGAHCPAWLALVLSVGSSSAFKTLPLHPCFKRQPPHPCVLQAEAMGTGRTEAVHRAHRRHLTGLCKYGFPTPPTLSLSSPSSSPKGPSLALIRAQQRLNKDGWCTTWGGGCPEPRAPLPRPQPPCFALPRRGLGRAPGCWGVGDARSRSGFSEAVPVTVTAPQDGSSSRPVQGGAPLPGNPGTRFRPRHPSGLFLLASELGPGPSTAARAQVSRHQVLSLPSRPRAQAWAEVTWGGI